MGSEDARLLVVRPDDHAIAVAHLRGFEVADGTATAGGAASITLELPPQATGEAVYDAVVELAPARLGGPSRVTFLIAAGATVELTADAVIAACVDAPVDLAPWPPSDPTLPPEQPTFIELPWRIRFAPRPHVAGDVVRATVPGGPIAGASGATGLWHLRLEAVSGLDLVPIGVEDDGDLALLLHRSHRDRIFAEGGVAGAAPTAPFVDLSPLGGTVSTVGTWPSFTWEHEIVLGR